MLVDDSKLVPSICCCLGIDRRDVPEADQDSLLTHRRGNGLSGSLLVFHVLFVPSDSGFADPDQLVASSKHYFTILVLKFAFQYLENAYQRVLSANCALSYDRIRAIADAPPLLDASDECANVPFYNTPGQLISRARDREAYP
jgi:hypothetical protein